MLAALLMWLIVLAIVAYVLFRLLRAAFRWALRPLRERARRAALERARREAWDKQAEDEMWRRYQEWYEKLMGLRE